MVEKNKKKLENKKHRAIFYQWNLGTRDMKSAKYPSRQKRKADFRKEVEQYGKENQRNRKRSLHNRA